MCYNEAKRHFPEVPMKPIFCTDVTNDKHSDAVNGDEFISATVSDQLREEIELLFQDAKELIKGTQLPTAWKFVRTAALFVAAGALILGDADAKSLLIGLAGFAAYIGLGIYESKRKTALISKEGDHPINKALETATFKVKEALNVPEDAVALDLLCFRYKKEEGDLIVQAAMGAPAYVNVEVFAYTDGENLCFADMERVYTFPLAEMHTIEDIMEPILLARWNKKTSPEDHGLAKKRGGALIHLYHILKFTHQGEDYGIYFPCYELEAIKKLTGLSETV
jgi:hypothetical protein